MTQPQLAGYPVHAAEASRAWRQLLARCKHAEDEVRRLRARLAELGEEEAG